MSDYSPSLVIQELTRIQQEAAKGVQALFDAEAKLASAERDYEVRLQTVFIEAGGTVADRQAVAKLEAAEARFQADLAKAELNRVRAKMKQLELAQMATQTISRQIEVELRVLK